MMKKILITKDNVRDYLEDGVLCIKPNYIVSPLALDELKRWGVKAVYEEDISCKEVCLEDDLCCKVEKILKEDHQIVDKTTIGNVQNVVLRVLNIK